MLSLPMVAMADSHSPEFSGQFRIRAEDSRYTNYSNDRDFFLMRVRPKITFYSGEAVSIVLAPQFSKTMGAPANTSGGVTDAGMSVHEAFIQYQLNPTLTFHAGRMIYSYGDELILGALEWNNVGRSFDGFKVRATQENMWVDVFANKISENTPAKDIDFYGIYSSFNFGDYFKATDFYLLDQRDHTAATISNLAIAGVRAASKISQIDYRTEFTFEFGNAVKDAYQFNIEAGYTFDHTMKPRLGVEYFTATQDFNSLYTTGHKWLGYADVLGRRNTSGIAIRTQANATDALKIKGDLHFFNRTSASAPAYQVDGKTALGSAAASASKTIGSEFDLTLVYAMEKNLTLSGGASLFFQGQYLEDQFKGQKPAFYYAQLELAF